MLSLRAKAKQFRKYRDEFGISLNDIKVYV